MKKQKERVWRADMCLWTTPIGPNVMSNIEWETEGEGEK